MAGGRRRHVGQHDDRPRRRARRAIAAGASASRKSQRQHRGAGDRVDRQRDRSPRRGRAAGALTRATATWVQPPGAAPRSMTRAPGRSRWKRSSSSMQLEGGARAIALAPRRADIGIVELAREPSVEDGLRRLAVLTRAAVVRRGAGCRRPSRAPPRKKPEQNAFADAAVGDHAGGRPARAGRSPREWRSRRAPDRRARSPMQGCAARSSQHMRGKPRATARAISAKLSAEPSTAARS